MLVRQTFSIATSEEPAQLTIECLNGPAQPAPLTADVLDRRLMSVARFVNGTARTFADWVKLFKEQPNALPTRDQAMFQKVGGDPSIHYVHGYWQLAPDEALVIDTEIPACTFWNIQLDNYWMESMDYRYLPAHVNAHTRAAQCRRDRTHRDRARGSGRCRTSSTRPDIVRARCCCAGSMRTAIRFPSAAWSRRRACRRRGRTVRQPPEHAHDRKDRGDRGLVHARRTRAAPARHALPSSAARAFSRRPGPSAATPPARAPSSTRCR